MRGTGIWREKGKIWMRGSMMYVTRVVRIHDDGKFYIVWYGNEIEVTGGHSGYYATVEMY